PPTAFRTSRPCLPREANHDCSAAFAFRGSSHLTPARENRTAPAKVRLRFGSGSNHQQSSSSTMEMPKMQDLVHFRAVVCCGNRRSMTRAIPFTAASLARAIKGVVQAGQYGIGVKADG